MAEIWLDTNILRQWNLRLDTAEAQKFFKFVEEWGHQILLPEVAFHELVEYYVRQAARKLEKQRQVKKSLKYLEIPVLEAEWADPPADLSDHYRQILSNKCDEKSITIVSLGQISIRGLLELSVKRQPPFQGNEGERGFRDSLILFSILDYAHQNELDRAVLVSGDVIFQKGEIKTLMAASNVTLDVYESVDALIAFFDTLVSATIKAMKRRQEERVRLFLLDHKQQIQEFIEQNAEFGEQFLAGSPPTLGSIRNIIGVSVEDVTNVSVITSTSEEEGFSLLFITFGVRLKIGIQMEINPFLGFSQEKRYRVGLEPEVHVSERPQEEITSLSREVMCEATAKEQASDKSLSALELKEVKARTPLDLIYEAITRSPHSHESSE